MHVNQPFSNEPIKSFKHWRQLELVQYRKPFNFTVLLDLQNSQNKGHTNIDGLTVNITPDSKQHDKPSIH